MSPRKMGSTKSMEKPKSDRAQEKRRTNQETRRIRSSDCKSWDDFFVSTHSSVIIVEPMKGAKKEEERNAGMKINEALGKKRVTRPMGECFGVTSIEPRRKSLQLQDGLTGSTSVTDRKGNGNTMNGWPPRREKN